VPEPPPRTYRVEVLPAAARELAKLEADARRRVSRKIDELAGDPRPHGVEKLSSEDDLYRVRVGDYRIIYQIRDEVLSVAAVKVGDRKEVYRHLDDLRKRLR
jgi:mRNA interferase RelE/StbE